MTLLQLTTPGVAIRTLEMMAIVLPILVIIIQLLFRLFDQDDFDVSTETFEGVLIMLAAAVLSLLFGGGLALLALLFSDLGILVKGGLIFLFVSLYLIAYTVFAIGMAMAESQGLLEDLIEEDLSDGQDESFNGQGSEYELETEDEH